MTTSAETIHPSEDSLRRFACGEMSGPPADAIEAHLETCDSCCDRLRQQGHDTLQARLKSLMAPMDTMLVRCASCTQTLKVKRQFAGKNVKCPKCGQTLSIPAEIAGAKPEVSRADAATLPPADSAKGSQPLATTDTAKPGKAGSLGPTQRAAGDASAETVPMIPGFEVLGVLGRGGMGVVYKARQVGLKRLVALKMILSGAYASQNERTRFLREAEAVARLQHPNIVQIHQIGEHDENPYFSLEYCDGGSLAGLLNGTPLPAADAAHIVRLLAQAMQAAHEQNIIHRDLKPANVLLAGGQRKSSESAEPSTIADGARSTHGSKSGPPRQDRSGRVPLGGSVPKITDFGLAKQLDEAGQTASGAVMGTPSYMAPEQASGETKTHGPAADIYALGAILYECLTGRPPFRAANSLETIMMVVGSDPVPPSQFNPKTPRDLETICLKCLQKEPRKRYGSAADLADDLARFENGEPISARPVGRVERGWRWCRRKPALAAAAALAIVGVLAALATFATATAMLAAANERERDKGRKLQIARDAEKDAKMDAQTKQKLADGARAKAEKSEQDAQRSEKEIRRLFYASQIRLGEQLWERGEILNLQHVLQSLLPRPNQEDLRGFEWYYLRNLTLSQGEFALAGRGSPVNALALSPDGNLLAAADGFVHNLGQPVAVGEVRVWDLQTKRVRFSLRGHAACVTTVAFAPDGNALATGGTDGMVRLWDRTGKQTALLDDHKAQVSTVCYSPDGKWLASAADAEPVFLRDAATGKVARSANLGRRSSLQELALWTHIAFLPDSQSLAVANGSGNVVAWDVKSGAVRPLAVSDTYPTRLAISPDGSALAVNSNTAKVNLIDLQTGEVRGSLLGHTRGTTAMAFSPKGEVLATGSYDGTVRLWDVRTGREQAALKGLQSSVFGVVFSHDASHVLIATEDGNVTGWDTTRKPGCTVAQGDGRVVRSMAFLPRSEEVAVVSGERYVHLPPGEVRVWHAGGGTPARIFQGTHRNVTGIALSPDEATLAISFGHPEFLRGGGELWLCGLADGARKVHSEPGGVMAAAYAPDGKRIALAVAASNSYTGAIQSRVKFLSTVDLKEQQPPLLVSGMATALAFSPDGRQLALSMASSRGTKSSTVQIWDAAAGTAPVVMAGLFEQDPCIAFSRDGAMLASAETKNHNKCIVRLWAAQSGKLLRTIDEWTGTANDLAFSADGESLAVADGSAVRVLSVANGSLRFAIEGELAMAAVFSPDGKYLATAKSSADLKRKLSPTPDSEIPSGEVRLWNAESGAAVATFQGYAGFTNQLVFSRDSKTLASRGNEGSVAVWDVAQAKQRQLVVGQDLPALRAHMQPVIAVAVAPDGKSLYTAGRDKLIKVWDQATGQVRATLAGHTEPVTVLAVSPDGKFLASGSGGRSDRLGRHTKDDQPEPGELILWDALKLKALATVPMTPGWVGGLAFTADGTLAVGVGSKTLHATVRFWDPATLKEQPDRAVTFNDADQIADGVNALAFDPVGSRLAIAFGIIKSGVAMGSVVILDQTTGKRLTTIKGHTNQVVAVTFAPNGKTLATSSKEGLVKLWQTSTGEELLTLRGHANWVNGLAFSPTGTTLASGARNGDSGVPHGELFFWNAPLIRQRTYYHDEATEGCAREIQTYDDRNNLAEIIFFNSAAQLVAPPLRGYARKVFTCDAQQELIDTAYFDAAGKQLAATVVADLVARKGLGERLGIRHGDILRSFKDLPIQSAAQFLHAVRAGGMGKLVFEREGVQQIVRLPADFLGVRLRDELLSAKELNRLGLALHQQNNLSAAVDAYRRALVLEPSNAEVWASLGDSLAAQKKLLEAAAAYTRGKFYVKAVRVHEQAVRMQAAVVANPYRGIRWRAACAAALAGSGQGDGAMLGEEVKAGLRAKARDWLRADLVIYEQHLAKGPAVAPILVARDLTPWDREIALASIRDRDALAKLPSAERQECQELWALVDSLLKQAAARFSDTRLQGTLTATQKSETHEFKMAAGKTYILDLESKDFDTFLKLRDPEGKLLAENDDIGANNFNSRLIFTPPADGSYRLIATSYQEEGTGAYTLRIREVVTGGAKGR